VDPGPRCHRPDYERQACSSDVENVDSRTVLVRQSLCTLAVVHAVPWPLHSTLGLFSECNPVCCRARGCTADSQPAGSVPRVLDAAGDTDIDAHLSRDHTCRRHTGILGTVAGGLVAALVLAVAGADSTVYEVVFPSSWSLLWPPGPWRVRSPAKQCSLLVAMLFAQMAPVSWRLAKVRIFDVVLGGLLGAVVGLLVWPRGATGEMRRTAKATLNAAANDLESTVGSLTHREVAASGQQNTVNVAVHFLMLAESTLAQYRSEHRSTSDHVDWLGVLGLAHEVVRGGQALRRTDGTAGPLPWPRVATDLHRLGDSAADQLRDIAALVSTNAGRKRAGPEETEEWMRGCRRARRKPSRAVRPIQRAQSECWTFGAGSRASPSIAGG
jgi:uncharacterized membrane protein YccC